MVHPKFWFQKRCKNENKDNIETINSLRPRATVEVKIKIFLAFVTINLVIPIDNQNEISKFANFDVPGVRELNNKWLSLFP